MPLQDFVVEDFSGGISDFILKSPLNKNRELENVNIDENNSLVSRGGSDFLAEGTVGSRVSGIFSDDEFKVFSSRGDIYSFLDGSRGQVLFNSDRSPFTIDTDTNVVAFSRILYHLYVTSNEHSFPQQIYYDESDGGALRMTQLGLPLPDTSEVVVNYPEDADWDNVNVLLESIGGVVRDASFFKRDLIFTGEVRDGGVLDSFIDLSNGYLELIGALGPVARDFVAEFRVRFDAVIEAEGTLCSIFESNSGPFRLTYDGSTLRLLIVDDSGVRYEGTYDVVLGSSWNDLCIQKSAEEVILYVNGRNVLEMTTAATLSASSDKLALGADAGDENALPVSIDNFRYTLGRRRYGVSYAPRPEPHLRNGGFLPTTAEFEFPDLAFQFIFSYRASNRLFRVAGPILYFRGSYGLSDSYLSSLSLTGLPNLVNLVGLNYDLSKTRLEISQSSKGNSSFNLIASLPVGSRAGVFSIDRRFVEAGNSLLRPIDEPDFDPPPRCKYVHAVGNVMHYGNCIVGNELQSDAVFESFADRPYHVNGVNSLRVQGEITGMNSIRDSLIVFTKERVYKKTGFFTESSVPTFVEIDGTSGAISNASIVKVQNQLFWAGRDQIYFTDGERVAGLGRDLLKRYTAMLENLDDYEHVTGCYDHIEDVILWTFKKDESRPDLDVIWSLDLRTIRGQGFNTEASITTWTGDDRSFSPTFVAFDRFGLIRGDRRGYLFRHNSLITSDPIISLSSSPEQWKRDPVKERIVTRILDFGNRSMRKLLSRISGTLSSDTSYSMSIECRNDEEGSSRALNSVFADSDGLVWGNDLTTWSVSPIDFGISRFERFRRDFPKGRLRANVFELTFARENTELLTSEVGLGRGVITGDQLALFAGVFPDLPILYEDLEIAFSLDNFSQRFSVREAVNGSLFFEREAYDLAEGISVGFKVYGVKLGQRLKFDDYTLHWRPQGKGALATGASE